MMVIMRKSGGQRAQSKQQSLDRILGAAAKRLCAEGLSGAAIVPIMRDAGLTHGAFYSHFSGKDDLAQAAFVHAVTQRTRRLIGTASDASWAGRLRRIARRYLSRAHRDDPADGCAFAALTSETARAPPGFRQAYQVQLDALLAAITEPFDKAGQDDRLRDEAIVLMALCVGGMSLARAVADRDLSDRIVRACANAFASSD
jgi:TetR/AcrR family transcriptional regulator, transcriptional repressor for nem operon